MNTRQKHWFFFIVTAIGAIVVVNLAILLMWTDMTEEERIFGRQIFSRVVTYGTLAMVVLFFISSQFILYIFRNYISPIETLTEETRLITVANAKYRIKAVGALETYNLTRVINELADSYISLKSDVKNIVAESKEGFEEKKLRLDTLMNMMSEGVIICNHDGRILSYNDQAYEICNSVQQDEVRRFSRLGLGRSIFSVFYRVPITYALEELQNNLSHDDKPTITNLITTRYKSQYLSVRISPVLKDQQSKTTSGYIFTLKDISKHIEEDRLTPYSKQFIILDEIVSITNLKLQNQFNYIVENGIWLDIQHHHVLDFFIALSEHLRNQKVKSASIGFSGNNKLRINWKGSEITFPPKEKKFKDLIINQEKNDGLVMMEIDAILNKQESEWKIKDPKESRPVFYNFDLFDNATKNTELDNQLLRDLTYVVFDTETTGLDPSGGDEIISIAGVRIIDGRINSKEIFDELVNPQRNIPLTSLKIHEIYPEMLDNKLTIDKILPIFHEFTDNAILVAHNAAFDMRFLQLKEEQTGVVFNNPVLDTLLLSAVCHPKQELHNLEDIAAKCGVEIIGRHTALGDSLVTAEVFLKLIPILEAMGIKTLGEAREACQKSSLSKIKF